jgi:acyl transferase domain-containing protein
LAFDYPTVNLIIAHVNEMIDPAHLDATEHSSLAAKLSAHSSNVHGIDIKSMAGCMPMTHMIKDCVQPISSRRWSADDEDIRKNNGMNSRMGSTINDIEMFDSQLFGVHSIEASAIDPQQRMILVHILSMLDGICMRDRSSTGIYTGIAWTEYKDVSNIGSETMSATTASATALSVASGRVSFCFNLKGPALSVDTACSSSLVAAHLGASAICENECSTAVTCGVNLTLLAHTSAMFHRAGMLASDGRCKTLDACANGYVRAEGCEVLMMAQAADAHVITLSGSAVNQDGRSSSLTAPNGPSQLAVIRHSLSVASLAASEVTCVQMHGTGTSLGDPIEVGGIAGALAVGDVHTVVLNAIKSSVGHAECAAGAIGLAQASITLSCTVVVGIMHLKNVNTHVSAAITTTRGGVDFVLPRSQASHGVQHGTVGVSSFAFQGTNAHATLRAGSARIVPEMHPHVLHEQRCWVTPPILSFTTTISSVQTQVDGCIEICTCISEKPQHASLLDHQVRGRALFPAAGFLEIASQAGMVLADGVHGRSIQGVTIPSPLVMKDADHCSTVVELDSNVPLGYFQFLEYLG